MVDEGIEAVTLHGEVVPNPQTLNPKTLSEVTDDRPYPLPPSSFSLECVLLSGDVVDGAKVPCKTHVLKYQCSSILTPLYSDF